MSNTARPRHIYEQPYCAKCNSFGLYQGEVCECRKPKPMTETNEPKRIPLKEDNPTGLHMKYRIQKFSHFKTVKDFFGWNAKRVPVFKDVDKDSEYFILRLDNKQKDPKHREACIKAVLCYAEAIKDHIPQLSKDLIERYGK